jgi:hypothetical protein
MSWSKQVDSKKYLQGRNKFSVTEEDGCVPKMGDDENFIYLV